MKTAHLTITTYGGVVPGASHYRGRLRIGKEEIDVEYKLTVKTAKQLNIEDRRAGRTDYTYKPGQMACRFFDEESVIKATVEYVQQNHPEIEVLFQGSRSILDPQPVLMGPEPIKTELNKLVAEAEAIDYWEEDEEKMQDIADRWEALKVWI